MNRRDFITLLGGGAAAWPIAARAQQEARQVVGFLSTSSPELSKNSVSAFQQGLWNAGFGQIPRRLLALLEAETRLVDML
jgi:putative ABC transport system substrate-binding protein